MHADIETHRAAKSLMPQVRCNGSVGARSELMYDERALVAGATDSVPAGIAACSRITPIGIEPPFRSQLEEPLLGYIEDAPGCDPQLRDDRQGQERERAERRGERASERTRNVIHRVK